MKRFLAGLVAVWICSALAAFAAAADNPVTDPPAQNVLAHGDTDTSWFARVVRVSDSSLGLGPSYEETQAYARPNGPGQQWIPLPAVPGRAVGIASRASQLVLLMNDGQWIILWGDNSSTGQTLPAEGKILAIADDGQNLWAAGLVTGGINAANAALARDASTRPSTSRASAAPSLVAKLVEATAQLISPNRLVIFRQDNSRWAAVSELPSDASTLSQDGVSLAIVAGSPVISFKAGKTTIRTLRYDPKATDPWIEMPSLEPTSATPFDDFELLNVDGDPILWWTRGNSPGELFVDSASSIKSVKLDWKGDDKLTSLPTITYAGGFIRVLGEHLKDGEHTKEIIEQRYEPDGSPVGKAAPLITPIDINETRIPMIVQTIFLVAVAFSVCASVWNWSRAAAMAGKPLPPPPAPLGARLVAGMIDLSPVLAVLFYMALSDQGSGAPWPSMESAWLLLISLGFYLLHTTAVETITGRSIGKWVMGLTVMSVSGTPATVKQNLIRNLLRVIDPLVMIPVSALRQRSSDVVAGTMVVKIDEVNLYDEDKTTEDREIGDHDDTVQKPDADSKPRTAIGSEPSDSIRDGSTPAPTTSPTATGNRATAGSIESVKDRPPDDSSGKDKQ